MSDFTTPALSVLGFFVGMLVWTQFTRWVGLLYVLGSKHGGDFLGPPKRRLLWAIPLLALLHPAAWLAGAVGMFAVRAFRADAGAGWTWFSGGLFFALLFMSLATLTALARWRRLRRSESSEPNYSFERTREG